MRFTWRTGLVISACAALAVFGARSLVGADKAAIAVLPGDKIVIESSRVTVHLKDAPLDDILQALAEQSGNKKMTAPDEMKQKRFTLDVADAPYWEAVDKLCAEAKFLCTIGMNGAMALVPATEDAKVNAYGGPFVLRMDTGFKLVRVRPPGLQGFYIDQQNGLHYKVDYYWEDRLRLLMTEVLITKAETSDGKAVAIADAPPKISWVGGFPGRGGGYSVSGSFYVTLLDVPRPVEKLKALEGILRAVAGTGERTVRVDDVLSPGEHKGTSGDVAVTVTSETKEGWTTLTIRQDKDGREVKTKFMIGGASPYGFKLVSPDGTELTNAPPRGAGGRVRTTGKGISFQDLPKVDGKWSLICILPDVLTEKEIPFRFNDVPVP